VPGLSHDLVQEMEESAARRKSEAQLYRLLAELVETERKYVQDLEQACDYYLQWQEYVIIGRYKVLTGER
jgi:hypothetical protein